MTGRSFKYAIDDRHVILNQNPNNNLKDSEKSTNMVQDSLLISLFDKLISSGPNYVCTCCTQTFFVSFVKNVNELSQHKKQLIEKYCTLYKSVDNLEWICQTCLEAARKGKTPKFWIHNGLKFPIQPNELNLSNLEERLVSPRIPFMQLREMPRGGQVSIKGNIVNVPADVNGTIKSLPRMVDENETIMLKLKRKLSYKHHVTFENIRPNKVYEAAKWLVRNSLLFRNEGIVVNETWMQQQQNISCQTEESVQHNESENQSNDSWSEDDSFSSRPTGNLDTFCSLLTFVNLIKCCQLHQVRKVVQLVFSKIYMQKYFHFQQFFVGNLV